MPNSDHTSNQLIPESDLVEGCIRGDARMQKAFYEQFAPKMFAVCFRYTSNQEAAQDLLQDGFIKVFKNLHRFRFEGSLEGWIRRIFVNTAIEQFRKKSLPQTSIGEKHLDVADEDDITALERLAEKDILKMIHELAPGYQAVFNLYVVEGYSHKEISELLGISEGTSKSQLARAKGILAKKVKEYLNETNKIRRTI